MDWSAVDHLWIIVMFLSAVWTLILTAPIHCRGLVSKWSVPMKKQTPLNLGCPEGEFRKCICWLSSIVLSKQLIWWWPIGLYGVSHSEDSTCSMLVSQRQSGWSVFICTNNVHLVRSIIYAAIDPLVSPFWGERLLFLFVPLGHNHLHYLPSSDSANKYGIRDNTLGQDAERDVFPLLNITLYMLHFNI